MASAAEKKRVISILLQAKDQMSRELRGGIRALKLFRNAGVGAMRAVARAATLPLRPLLALTRPIGFLRSVLAGLAVREIVRFIKGAAEMGDELAKMSKRTGISVKALSEWTHVADIAGTSIETVEKSVRTMQNRLLGAERSISKSTFALDQLGVSFADIQGQAPEKQFNTILEALAGVEDPSRRAALAMRIFGKSGTELLPILEEGADGIRALREEAGEFGIVFDAITGKKSEQIVDAFKRVNKAFIGLRNRIVLAFGDDIVRILNSFTKAVVEVGKRAGELAAVIHLALNEGTFRQEAIGVLGQLGQSVSLLFRTIGETAAQAMGLALVTGIDIFGPILLKRVQIAWGGAIIKGLSASLDLVEAATGGVIVNRLRNLVPIAEQLEPLLLLEEVRAATQEASGLWIAFGDLVAAKLREVGESFGLTFEDMRDLIRLTSQVLGDAAGAAADQGKQAAQEVSDFVKGIEAELTAFAQAFLSEFQAGRDLVRGVIGELASASDALFDSLIDGTREWRDAFDDAGRQILKIIAQVASRLAAIQVTKALFPSFFDQLFPGGSSVPGLFGSARGNVLRRGELAAFAAGGLALSPGPPTGLITRPTLFPMARGFGLAGEAGTEVGIAPLARTPSGRLGVEAVGAGGGQPVNINFNVTAADARSFDQLLAERGKTITDIVRAAIERRTDFRQQIRDA